MEHPMRRADRALDDEASREILRRGEYGVLSTCDLQGVPYGVPLNYAQVDGALVFHAARGSGRKLENLLENLRASFTVVEGASVVPEKFSERYRSVIVAGRVRLAVSTAEKHAGLMALVDKYSPDYRDEGRLYADRSIDHVDVLIFDIESLTGKHGRR